MEYLSKSKCIPVYEKEICQFVWGKERASNRKGSFWILFQTRVTIYTSYKLLSKEMGRLQENIEQNGKGLGVCEREI